MCKFLWPLLVISTFTVQISPELYALALKTSPSFLSQHSLSQDRKAQAEALRQDGLEKLTQRLFGAALNSFEQELIIRRELKDRLGEARTLNNVGFSYQNLNEPQKAIEFYQQSLAISQQLQEHELEAKVLINLGSIYFALSQYQQAIEYHQQSLKIYRQIANRQGEANALNNLGNAYDFLSQHEKAIEYYQQSLDINRQTQNRKEEANTLNGMGNAYYSLNQYDKAIDCYQQSLDINRQINSKKGEAYALGNLGNVYYSLNQYAKAINYYQQNLNVMRQIQDNRGEANALNNLGLIYKSLSQYTKAIKHYEQSLAIYQQIKDVHGEASTLNNLGNVYESLKQPEKAIKHYEQSLEIKRQIKDNRGQANTLNNLGLAYSSLSQYGKAVDYFQQSLEIKRQIKDRQGEANALNNLGFTYGSLREYTKAINYFQQSLSIYQQVKDRQGEGIALNNLSEALTNLNQIQLASFLYKQSVNVLETIRTDLTQLNRDEQQSYLNSVEDIYNRLANLLLRQDRVLEAMQVLDLLKAREYREFFKHQNYQQKEAPQLDLLPQEQTILTQFNTKIQQGEDLNTFFSSPQIKALTQQLNQTATQQNLTLPVYNQFNTAIKQLGNRSALLYPLILPDRLELILFTPDIPPIRRTIFIKQQHLEATIETFRNQLGNSQLTPLNQLQLTAKQLYDWIIAPLTPELSKAEVQTLIYAPVGQLRYIPLAALYNGNQWLVERYRINHLTALSLTDLTPTATDSPTLLAGAFTTGRYTVPVGNKQVSYSGLPFAKAEVEIIRQGVDASTVLFDQDFNANILPQLQRFGIVHFATHAAFVPGNPENSFILLGNGQQISLKQTESWQMKGVRLVVLSACETGIGGRLKSGIEVLGFGYQMQRTGVRATLATLWQVNDGGTSVVMDRFYQLLIKEKLTVAEALRQAQQDMITADRVQGRGIWAPGKTRLNLGNLNLVGQKRDQLNHPYYWAPFILVGNGL